MAGRSQFVHPGTILSKIVLSSFLFCLHTEQLWVKLPGERFWWHSSCWVHKKWIEDRRVHKALVDNFGVFLSPADECGQAQRENGWVQDWGKALTTGVCWRKGCWYGRWQQVTTDWSGTAPRCCTSFISQLWTVLMLLSVGGNRIRTCTPEGLMKV